MFLQRFVENIFCAEINVRHQKQISGGNIGGILKKMKTLKTFKISSNNREGIQKMFKKH